MTPSVPASNEAPSERCYLIAKEYRRAAGIGIAGCVLNGLVGGYIGIFVLNTDLPRIAVVGLLLFTVASLLTGSFLTSVRANSSGILKRRFWGWDEWKWEVFSSERIHRGSSRYSFTSLDRPFWRNQLHLELLEKEDAETLVAQILEHWKPLANQDLNLQTTINYRWPWRLRIDLSPAGIRILDRGGEKQFPWSDLQRVDIWKFNTRHDGFCSLTFQIPDRSVTIPRLKQQQHVANQYWNGSRADEILAVIYRHTDSTRIHVWTLDGPPRDFEELNARVRRFKERKEVLLQGNQIAGRMPLLLNFLWVFSPDLPDWRSKLGMIALFGTGYEALFRLISRKNSRLCTKQIQEYERQQGDLFRQRDTNASNQVFSR